MSSLSPAPTLINSLVREILGSSHQQWSYLLDFALAPLVSVRIMELDERFLKSAAGCWSPRDHVFRFNGVEICPLQEEFAAILGKEYVSSSILVALPYLESDSVAFMVPLFNLRAQTLLLCTENGMITLSELLENCRDKPVGSSAWKNILAFCLYSAYLLTNPDGTGDIEVARIIDQVGQGANPFPVILAETFVGLDWVSRGGRFRGSPMLLQV